MSAAALTSALMPLVNAGLTAGITATQAAVQRRRERKARGELPRQRRRARQPPPPRLSRAVTVRAPVSVGTRSTQPGSSQVQSAEEQFYTISGSTAYSLHNFVANPLAAVVFPRLSQVASQYQKFTVSNLSYTYTPSCPTSTQGNVYMAFVPDYLTELPTSITEMKGILGCVSTVAWTPASLTTTPSMRNQIAKEYYLRSGIGSDNLNNAGTFLLATDSCLNTAKLGFVTVKYTIVLHQPRTLPGGSTLSSSFDLSKEDFDFNPQSPLVYDSINNGTVTLKRASLCPLLFVVRGEANLPPPAVYQGAVELDALIYGVPQSTPYIALFLIPASQDDVYINSFAIDQHGFVTALGPKHTIDLS